MTKKIVLPDFDSFTSHDEVEEYAHGELLELNLPASLLAQVVAMLPDLRTEEELAEADMCSFKGCEAEVFVDTRWGYCQRHNYEHIIEFLYGGMRMYLD